MTSGIDNGFVVFLSTSSARRTTIFLETCKAYHLFLSTSSARRTTHHIPTVRLDQNEISIHVLREEDDTDSLRVAVPLAISIHVLREEDDFAL